MKRFSGERPAQDIACNEIMSVEQGHFPISNSSEDRVTTFFVETSGVWGRVFVEKPPICKCVFHNLTRGVIRNSYVCVLNIHGTDKPQRQLPNYPFSLVKFSLLPYLLPEVLDHQQCWGITSRSKQRFLNAISFFKRAKIVIILTPGWSSRKENIQGST